MLYEVITEVVALLLWPRLFHRLAAHCMFFHRIPYQTTVIAVDDQFKSWKRLYHKTVRDMKRSGKTPLFFMNPYTKQLPEFQTRFNQVSEIS